MRGDAPSDLTLASQQSSRAASAASSRAARIAALLMPSYEPSKFCRTLRLAALHHADDSPACGAQDLSLSLSLALSLSLSSCLLFAQDNSCKVHAHFFKPSRGSAQDTHTAGGVRPACFQQRQIASLCCLYPISPIHFRGQKRATLGGSSLKKKFTKKKYLTASSPRMGPVSNEALRKRFDVAADCVRGEARSAM